MVAQIFTCFGSCLFTNSISSWPFSLCHNLPQFNPFNKSWCTSNALGNQFLTINLRNKMNRESIPSNDLCGSHAEVAMILLITKLKKIDLDHLNFAKLQQEIQVLNTICASGFVYFCLFHVANDISFAHLINLWMPLYIDDQTEILHPSYFADFSFYACTPTKQTR